MRKFLFFGIVGFLFLFGTTVYAQAPKLDFRASGFIDTQTVWDKNVPVYNAATGLLATPSPTLNAFTPGANTPANALNRVVSWWEGRAHLKFDAVMGKELSGTIYFEIDTFRWGSTFNAGGALTREANNIGAWTTDRAGIEVKNVYMDIGLPYFGIPVPATVRVDAQTFAIRPNMFVYSDGTGVMGGIKIDPVELIPYYFKALEGLDFADDDVDVWGLQAKAKFGAVTIGGYGVYYRMNTYPFFVVTGPVIVPSAGQTAGFTGIAVQNPGTNKSHMWWFGAYADGKLGPVDFNFDFVYDYGKVEERNTPNIPDVKYQGWATRLKVDYPWDKFNIGAVGMYASGSDAKHTSINGLPGSTTSGVTTAGTFSKAVRGFVVPPGSEQGAGVTFESVVVYGTEPAATGGVGLAMSANYAALSRGAFGGTWFAKAYGSAKVTPWYKVTLQGLYIGDTTSHGNTLGTAVRRGTTLRRDDKDIGYELNLMNDFQIYRNLRFWVAAGYLWPGAALDLRRGTSTTNFSMINPWAVRTRLIYTF